MIKQTKEEAAAYVPLSGRSRTYVGKVLATLDVGEAIIIEKGKDWVTKSSPFRVVNYFAKKNNRQFEKRPDAKGWWVKRTA